MSRFLLFLYASFLIFGCKQPLVNTGYGTTGQQSINGLSIIRIILKEFGEVKETAYVSRKDFENYDLIVHFEKNPDPQLYSDIDEALLSENFWIEMPVNELERESYFDPVVLYFYRSHSTEYWFWSRVNEQMTPDGMADRFTKAAMAFFEERRQHNFLPQRIKSRMHYEPEVVEVPVTYRTMNEGPARIPVQSFLSYDSEFPEVERLAIGASGSFFMRSVYDHCNLFTISSSEPFLDYHLVRPEMRMLARNIFRKALQYARPSAESGKYRILLVKEGMRPVWQAAKEERKFWQILTVQPWNVILGLFLLTMILLIWSRWSYQSPPVLAPEPGSRKFVEHFEALGRRLENTGLDSFESLERLKARQRGRIND